MRRVSAAIAPVGVAALSPLAAQAASFDGNWNVTQECETAPGGARGFKWTYDATVKQGRLVGQHGTKDKPSSLTLTGRIQSDGSATLTASGMNGKSDYTVGFGQPGEKFSYRVTAQDTDRAGPGGERLARVADFQSDLPSAPVPSF